MTNKELKSFCTTFKPMKYFGTKGKRDSELIAKGTYEGITFVAVNNGSHPCAYVNVAGTKYDGKDYWNDNINLDCHGGLTYSKCSLPYNGIDYEIEGKQWWLGWDYAHLEDKMFYSEGAVFNQEGKAYTTQEIVSECIEVIKQLIDIDNRSKSSNITEATQKVLEKLEKKSKSMKSHDELLEEIKKLKKQIRELKKQIKGK